MTTTKSVTGWTKYHVLRYEKGRYSYECDRGLFAGGPWDNRPNRCKGIGCGRELIEQSALDAAIQQARDADLEQLAALRAALQQIVDRDTLCTCEHNTEFCCARVNEYCAFCIASNALGLPES